MRRACALSLALLAALLAGCASRGHLIVRKGRRRPLVSATAGPLPAAGALTATAAAAAAAPVPAPAPAVPAPAEAASPPPLTVSARPGDCLWLISRHTLGSGFLWPRIAEANHLASPWVIEVGQVIAVPQGARSAPEVPLPAPSEAPAPPPRRRLLNEARRYGFQAVPNDAFTVGERLTFAVQYGNVTAGYATLSIPEAVELDGRPCFHVVAQARTHPFFETFFRVNDRLDSYIDVDYAFPWRYEKHIQEGGFRADASYDYDHRACQMREPAKGTSAEMPTEAQDVLSCFYFYRTQPMVVGAVSTIPVTADDKQTYELKVDALRRERVSTLAGDFDCVVVQPHLTFNGVFQQKGDVFLWITDDQRRIPVMVRSKIAIGSINVNLQDAEWVEPSQGEGND
jgi:LysM repeat protein